MNFEGLGDLVLFGWWRKEKDGVAIVLYLATVKLLVMISPVVSLVYSLFSFMNILSLFPSPSYFLFLLRSLHSLYLQHV